ncbi:hypothetical protein BIW11_02928 [Tropilaelaps mercedesae]|uniref:Transmembrane protein n=1 Tax=Tropilaelaps mercedesae TaxID=418985 RepID=A0A1V9XVC9_9ACAR|nr:hypothetical protein BIW11_02928 [Tropilaelaps mercedesae]
MSVVDVITGGSSRFAVRSCFSPTPSSRPSRVALPALVSSILCFYSVCGFICSPFVLSLQINELTFPDAVHEVDRRPRPCDGETKELHQKASQSATATSRDEDKPNLSANIPEAAPALMIQTVMGQMRQHHRSS